MTRLLARAADALRAGRPADALPPLRALAALRPGDAAVLHDLGLACLDSGQIAEAVSVLRAAVSVNPGFADAYLRLGIALEAAGDVAGALSAYRSGWSAQPGLADAHYRAGNLLETLGRMAEAVNAFRRSASSAPHTLLGRIAAARALLAQDKDAEAEEALRRALACEPGNAAALELLGNLLADAGRFEEARDALVRAVQRDPRRAGAFYEIARCRPISAADTDFLAQMQVAATQPGLEPAQRSRVQLALGKALADLGRFELAMRAFDTAEALRREVLRFDLSAYEARIDLLVEGNPPGSTSLAGASSVTSPAPILILGLPRSGTTLVEQILSSHPDVHAGGEMSFWNERGTVWEAAWPFATDQREGAFLERAAADYRAVLGGICGGALRVTDKMPLNLHWAGQIHRAMPDAVIVHCVRSPIDTAVSIHRTHFNPRMAFPTGGSDLVGTIRAARRLAAHWRRILPPDRFIEVEYESLVGAADCPERAIRYLVSACGLEWSDACLHPERNLRVVKTASKWQARQPINRTSVGGWRNYAPWLGPLSALVTDEV